MRGRPILRDVARGARRFLADPAPAARRSWRGLPSRSAPHVDLHVSRAWGSDACGSPRRLLWGSAWSAWSAQTAATKASSGENASAAADRSASSNATATATAEPTARLGGLHAEAAKPAILVCTSKVVIDSQREDYEAWLVEGKGLIEAVLRDEDCAPEGHAKRAGMTQGRFSWVHFPATHGVGGGDVDGGEVEHVRHSGAPRCETVAVVFQRHDDLERWRTSRRRREWLRRGERFNGDGANGAGAGDDPLTSRATAINVDDGSLGGWLPADPDMARPTAATSSSTSSSTPSTAAVPSWKVYTAVVLAQYPLYELNALVLLPAVEAAAAAAAAAGADGSVSPLVAAGAAFAALPQAVRGLAVAAWTAVGAVFVTLPAAQRLLRWYGFIGGVGAACPGLPELSRGAAATAATYVAVTGGFHLVQHPGAAEVAAKIAGGGA